MKNLLLLSFIAIFIFACNNDSTNESNTNNDNQTSENTESSTSADFIKYPFEAGIVVYKNEMMGMSSTMTLYFEDYGKTQCIASQTEMMEKKINTRIFEKDGYFYSLLMDQKTGVKHKMTKTDEGFGKTNPFAFKEEYIKEFGGKKEGNETIIGKECSVYSFVENGIENKIWVWDNLIVKIEAEQNGMKMLMEITKIEETDELPDGIFDVPADFTITEEENFEEAAEDFIDENAKG